MIAVKALYKQGKIEFLDPPPDVAQALVAVVFLDMETVQDVLVGDYPHLYNCPTFFILRSEATKNLISQRQIVTQERDSSLLSVAQNDTANMWVITRYWLLTWT